MALLYFLVLFLVLGTTSLNAETKFIQISSGPVGGTYYILGGALADLLKDTVEGVKFTVTTGGSLANISKIEAGKAEIGFTIIVWPTRLPTASGSMRARASI